MSSILTESEVSRAQFGPRDLKDPHSKEYAIQTLQCLKLYAETLRCDQNRVAAELDKIDKYRHWEVLGYESRAAMFAAELNELGLDNIRAQVARAKESPLAEHGTNRFTVFDDYTNGGNSESEIESDADVDDCRGETASSTPQVADDQPANVENDRPCNTSSSSPTYGTVDYTLRRLARDGHEELLSQIESGEKSVNQAAIEAGIRKKPSKAEICVNAFRKAENRLEVLRIIVTELEAHEKAIVRDWLQSD